MTFCPPDGSCMSDSPQRWKHEITLCFCSEYFKQTQYYYFKHKAKSIASAENIISDTEHMIFVTENNMFSTGKNPSFGIENMNLDC